MPLPFGNRTHDLSYTGVRKDMGSILDGDSDYLRCSMLFTEYSTVSYCFARRKIYYLSFFIIAQDAFDIADPSCMQDACNPETS